MTSVYTRFILSWEGWCDVGWGNDFYRTTILLYVLFFIFLKFVIDVLREVLIIHGAINLILSTCSMSFFKLRQLVVYDLRCAIPLGHHGEHLVQISLIEIFPSMHGQVSNELLPRGAVIILSKIRIVEVFQHAIISWFVPSNLLLINLIVHSHLRLLHHFSCHFFKNSRDSN